MNLDPNLVAIAIFVAGFIAAKWDRDRSAQTKAVQVDTELREKVRALEDQVREHSGIARSVTRLETLMTTQASTLQAFQRDLHEMRMWIMGAQRPRSPFDFAGAREWVEQDVAATERRA